MNKIVSDVLIWKKRLATALTVALGLLLSACQTTDAAAVMALEEVGGEERHLVKKVFGGLVIAVDRDRFPGHAGLLIRRVPVGFDGRPLCRKAGGSLLRVSRVKRVFAARAGRLRSAFLVMGDRSLRGLRDLAVGQCVTVAPDEEGPGRDSVSPRIRILSSRKTEPLRARIALGIVTIWGRISQGIPPPAGIGLAPGKNRPRAPKRSADSARSPRRSSGRGSWAG